MSPLKFVKALAATYFSEKDRLRDQSRRVWNSIFIGFFALYLLQIYGAYYEWQSVLELNRVDPDRAWQAKLSALYLQGIVLFGIFIKFLTAHFRGKWFVRFGESGELIAFAAFLRHFLRSMENPSPYYSRPLDEIPNLCGVLIVAYFTVWAAYKILRAFAVGWKTVRK
jgi:hypothetical protein